MTPEDRQVILQLFHRPGIPRTGSPEQVLRHFGVNDGHELGMRLLREAADDRNAGDLEYALTVCHAFGFTMEHLDPLLHLLGEDWHHSHEDIVTALDILRTPKAIDSLYQATVHVPQYLDYDESRALAKKAIHALGRIPTKEAEEALVRAADSVDETVRKVAERQLARRRQPIDE